MKIYTNHINRITSKKISLKEGKTKAKEKGSTVKLGDNLRFYDDKIALRTSTYQELFNRTRKGERLQRKKGIL